MSAVQPVARQRGGPEAVFHIASRGVVHPIAFAGTGSYLPPEVLDAATFDALVGKPAGWSERSSGVRSRHVVQHETVIDMATAAARQAIARAGIAAQDIECIIASGTLPHQEFRPSM
jgi:3-oxoacyl-[acyl-carrier-protein] synthase III